MTRAVPPCPTQPELEAFLQSGRGDTALRRHVTGCDACRARVEEISADNAFLADFARYASASAASRPALRADAADDAVDGYRLERVIGRGGQAVVYEAVQASTDRRVALKMMLAATGRGGRRAERFDREIRLAAALRHPAIVTVYDSGLTASGRPYFTMEYIAGCPVTESLAGVEPAIVLDRFIRVCDAVSYSHTHGVIHRDLKPSNILVDADGQPRVLDFGLAKAVQDSRYATITATGEFLGTLAYAAPEQVQRNSELADTRTDVYALGVILYEILAGELPYPVDGSVADVVRNITEQVPDPPSRRRDRSDDELDTIVLTALAKDPDRRYASAAALLDDLERYRAGDAIAAKRDSAWYVLGKAARRHRVVVSAAAVLLVLLVAFSITMTVLLREKRIAEASERHRAQELAATLSASNIERARMMNEARTAPLAEALLWTEHLAPPADETAARVLHVSSTWALRELYARHPCLATATVHDGPVRAVEVAADGGVITAGADGVIARWDPATGAVMEIRRLPAPGGTLLLSGNGDVVARAGSSVIELWALRAEERRATIETPGANGRVAIDHRGDVVATADGGRVARWDGRTGALLEAIELQDAIVHALAFGPAREGLVLACENDVRLWDRGGRTARVIAALGHGPPSRAAAGAEGVWIGAASSRWFEPIRLPDGAQPQLGAHGDLVTALAFGPGGLAASGSLDTSVRPWHLDDSRAPASYHGHRAPVTAIAVAPDGRGIASADESGVVKWWESSPFRWVADRPVPRFAGLCIRSAPDDDVLVAGGATPGPDGERGVIHVIDRSDPAAGRMLDGHEAPVSSVAVTPDGTRVVSAGYDRTIRIWNLATSAPATVLRGPQRINDLALGPDGHTAVTGSADDGDLGVWDLVEGRLVATLPGHRLRVPSVDFSPTGACFASSSADGSAIVWDALTHERRHVLRGHRSGVRATRFSPDGALLATGGDDWTVRLWDVATGAATALLAGHERHLFALAFSPDGRLLASGDRGGVIHLWDVASGRNLATLERPGPAHPVMGLDFMPDGRTLVAVDGPGRIAEWDLTHYDRHIAGNLAHQRSAAGGGEDVGPE